jgi:indole-3-acetate monooxygenase
MLMTAHDPSTTLLTAVETLEPFIRYHADEAERQRQLTLPVVQALTDAGLFRMCVPRALGGLEVPPLTFYRVVEAVARLDGSNGLVYVYRGERRPRGGLSGPTHRSRAVWA